MGKDGDLFVLIGIIAVMALASGNAFVKGGSFFGSQSAANSQATEQTTPAPIVKQDIQNQIRNANEQLKNLSSNLEQFSLADSNPSPYRGQVTINSVHDSTDPEQEYVVISSNSSQNILLTGWKLQGTGNGTTAEIGNGTYLFYYGITNPEEAIYLRPWESAVISTGRSPLLGRNFKINKCSGYLTQSRDFTPSISNYNCPMPSGDDVAKVIPNNSDQKNINCYTYIFYNMPRCQAQLTELDKKIYNQACRDYINSTFNMNACINGHITDTDFDSREWRIYLGRSAEMWKDKDEVVRLLDSQGRVVSYYTY